MPDPEPARRAIPGVLVVIIVLSALACGALRGAAPPPGPGEATVSRVVDGDTLVARLGDEEETVRLIGIDTPETKRPGTPVECFGAEAADRLTGLLPEGTVVRLERDREERDRYGRLLAYVHRLPDEVFVNEAMVADGFADAYRVTPNVARAPELAAAAGRARAGGLGLWGRCGGGHEPLPP